MLIDSSPRCPAYAVLQIFMALAEQLREARAEVGDLLF
jgi:hypothetical protein